jgi:hypothetical protein
MPWAVEYELPGGTIGICIFTAEDLQAAQIYIEKMQTQHGHHHVFNLNELPPDTGIQDLYRLFPRRQSGTPPNP